MARVVFDGKQDGPTNMARDFALTQSGEICGRVYSWTEPWVTLGKHQRLTKLQPDCPVPTVVRPTGGKAVLHGHDVTFALCYPLNELSELMGRIDSFRHLSGHFQAGLQPVVIALNNCGVPAILRQDLVMDAPTEREHFQSVLLEDCFHIVRPCDIVEPKSGKKLCGVAALETRDFILFQGSIPTSEPSVDPGTVFRYPARQTISNLDVGQFCKALSDALATFWPESPA